MLLYVSTPQMLRHPLRVICASWLLVLGLVAVMMCAVDCCVPVDGSARGSSASSVAARALVPVVSMKALVEQAPDHCHGSAHIGAVMRGERQVQPARTVGLVPMGTVLIGGLADRQGASLAMGLGPPVPESVRVLTCVWRT